LAPELPGKSKKPMGGLSISAWLRIRRGVQAASLIGLITIIVSTQRESAHLFASNLFIRLDPLLMVANLFASRLFLFASSIALITIILTIIFGRVWCGWICPLGTTLDIFSFPRRRKSVFTIPDSWRKIKYFLLFTILIAALFGNLTLLLLDPITIFYRTFTISILPLLSTILTQIETALYQIPILADPVSSLDELIRPLIIPYNLLVFRGTIWFTVVFASIICLNTITPRFWCRYLCPLGAMLGWISKFSLFRRIVNDECKNCGLCDKNCPTGTIDPNHNYSSDPSECIVCMECFKSCQQSTLRLSFPYHISARQNYDPDRRLFLGAAGMAIITAALFKTNLAASQRYSFYLLPPGSTMEDIQTRCLRCGACIRICPTGAIQTAVTEAGLQGFSTPVLIPRIGYCDYSCNACGMVCPVQAIPKISIEQKRLQVIGKAYINTDRCIAWSDHRDCIVCQEMCPLPQKAIELQGSIFQQTDGSTITIQTPYVFRERCIGCGICENKCPVKGTAAIQVYIPTFDEIIG
jgi:polyferredoxin